MQSGTAPGTSMRFADLWEGDIFPPELLDMILHEALPRRLEVRLRLIDHGEGQWAESIIEAVNPSDWNLVKELLAYSSDVRKTTLRFLKEDSTLIFVDTVPQRINSYIWPNRGLIDSESASNLVKLSAPLLTHFRYMEVTTPYIIGFGQTPSDGFRNPLMLRCTVRCHLPRPDRDELPYDTEWEVNTGSCTIYEPRALSYVMEYVEAGLATYRGTLEVLLARTSDVYGFLTVGDTMAIEVPDTEWPGLGGFGGGLIWEIDEGASEYGYRIATTRLAQTEYENAGKQGGVWPSEWSSIKWDDVQDMIMETKKKAAIDELEEGGDSDGEVDQVDEDTLGEEGNDQDGQV
ncbi:hypothetical protein PRZ48_008959 [Zasmidium cellare]|uniref:Uncharacterized protein n=1 Tax=Zasmidium cellare TaxID=395010 RepID=A0ABR0EH03_ZASCE|nr:hypothetical protein PRZ48_008959 [Zasmidium cellare]